MRSLRALLLLLPMAAVTLQAHTGEPLEPHDLWTAWEFDPATVILLLLTAVLYGRGSRLARGVSARQRAYFWSGWTVLTLALVSPLHALGEALFSAHMTQHELLMLVAAPLLVLARPLVTFLWALPLEWRRGVGRWSKFVPVQTLWTGLTAPFTAWLLHAIILWGWHVPFLFQATLTSAWVHAAQHASFLGSALLFWWSLFYARSSVSYGAGVLYLFTTAIHTSALGALLTFAGAPWYPAYARTVPAWGLTAIEDQQIGGLIMWVPGGLVYTAAGLFLFGAWLRASGLPIENRRRHYAAE